MQAQYTALATQAEGTSVITETIFENRYLHASEMVRMGANISVDGRRAVVRGPAPLSGTTVQASDLRASAGLTREEVTERTGIDARRLKSITPLITSKLGSDLLQFAAQAWPRCPRGWRLSWRTPNFLPGWTPQLQRKTC